ncbi:MAG: glycosyltransferase [Rhodospirillaceae bacterium]|nr:glycosyltransferase [Rhodospirillaceae bacterium]
MATEDCSPPLVAVCVPARDERRRLAGLLRALARQCPLPRVDLVVCILFDGSGDGGDAAVRQASGDLPFSVVTRTIARQETPNAGRARRAAMALGQDATDGMPQALLLTTDADTRPARNWVARNAASLNDVDVVAGHIARSHACRVPIRSRLEAYYGRLHRLRRTIDPVSYDPLPSHPSIGGASLGFRASAYAALGGFPELACNEDVAMVASARHAGFRVRHDPRVRVVTSSRRVGRARGGLADDLLEVAVHRSMPSVEHPAQAAERFVRRAAARRLFAQLVCPDTLDRLSGLLDQSLAVVAQTARLAPNADAFAVRIVRPVAERHYLPLPDAEAHLAGLEAEFGYARA